MTRYKAKLPEDSNIRPKDLNWLLFAMTWIHYLTEIVEGYSDGTLTREEAQAQVRATMKAVEIAKLPESFVFGHRATDRMLISNAKIDTSRLYATYVHNGVEVCQCPAHKFGLFCKHKALRTLLNYYTDAVEAGFYLEVE